MEIDTKIMLKCNDKAEIYLQNEYFIITDTSKYQINIYGKLELSWFAKKKKSFDEWSASSTLSYLIEWLNTCSVAGITSFWLCGEKTGL